MLHESAVRWSLLAILGAGAVVALSTACEEGSSLADAPPPSIASMPRAPEPIASASPSAPPASIDDASDAGEEAAPPIDEGHHAVLVTACSADRRGCRRAQAGSRVDEAAYRVSFGRGPGSVRTRGQAMADLYKEIRDRTQGGESLAAEAHRLGDPPARTDDSSRAHHVADDPLVEAAFQLMDEVDRAGELTVDAVSNQRGIPCRVSLDTGSSDAGISRCLVEAPATSTGRPGRGH